MKRVFSVLLIIALCLSLNACTSGSADTSVNKELSTDPTNHAKVTASTAQSTVAPTDESTLKSTAKPTTVSTTGATTLTTTEPTTAPATATSHTHSFSAATCTVPKTCSCGATSGDALGHSWQEANCVTPKTCKTCGITEGDVAQHTFEKYVCTVCNSIDDKGIAIATNPKLSFKPKTYHTNHYVDDNTIRSERIVFILHDSGIGLGIDFCTTALPDHYHNIPIDSIPRDTEADGEHPFYTVFNGTTYYSNVGSGYAAEELTYELTDSEIIVSSPTKVVLKFKMNADGDLIVTYSTLTEGTGHRPKFNVGDICW